MADGGNEVSPDLKKKQFILGEEKKLGKDDVFGNSKDVRWLSLIKMKESRTGTDLLLSCKIKCYCF